MSALAYSLPLLVAEPGQPCVLEWAPLIASVLDDLRRDDAASRIARAFQATRWWLVGAAVAVHVGHKRIALSGGCFQNRRLTEQIAQRLRGAGHDVLLHRQTPPNDGCIEPGAGCDCGGANPADRLTIAALLTVDCLRKCAGPGQTLQEINGMNVDGQHFRTIWVKEDDPTVVQIIDQRPLPQFVIEDLTTVDEMAVAIKEMHVRGAGLIGAAAGYGMYIAALHAPRDSATAFRAAVDAAGEQLKATRPTAVNLAWAVDRQLAAMAAGR